MAGTGTRIGDGGAAETEVDTRGMVTGERCHDDTRQVGTGIHSPLLRGHREWRRRVIVPARPGRRLEPCVTLFGCVVT